MYLLALLILLLDSGWANPSNSPISLQPGGDYQYPNDYCDNFNPKDKFDFIVIGAGAGGATVSRRLAEVEDFNILLLEAGDDPPKESQLAADIPKISLKHFWQFKTTPVKNGGCEGFKRKSCLIQWGKVLGGSTTINSMIYVRGHPEDFNEIEALGNPGWGYKDMLPYFKNLENYIAPLEVGKPGPLNETDTEITNDTKRMMESDINPEFHGFGGPITTSYFPTDPFSQPLRDGLIEAMDQLMIPFNADYNGPSQFGYTILTGSIDELGYRYGAAKGYLTNTPKNLKVCKNAFVTKINLENKKATSVEFTINRKKMKVAATKEYIISGGPLNTPGILERSGIGNKSVLKRAKVKLVHELNGVGENLNNHYFNLAGAYKVGNVGTVAASNPLSIGLASLCGFFNYTDVNNTVTDTQLSIRFYNPKEKFFENVVPSIRKQFDEAGNVLIATPTSLRGHPSGSVHISQDPKTSPIITEKPYGNKDSIEREIRNQKIFRNFMSSPALEKFKIEPLVLKECQRYPFNSDQEIMCGANLLTRPMHHVTGTASMGPTSKKYVVNERLKVHGIKNVRVVDSSVLPLVPRGNSQVSSYAVGEKGADIIKEDYGVIDKS